MSPRTLCTITALAAAVLQGGIKAAVVKHSFPFDSYRITCPREYAVRKASLQVVQSIGRMRTDYLTALYCDSISKLFPPLIKMSTRRLEDECRWTDTADLKKPIYFNATCGNHEYLSGLTRRGMNQMGFLCCQVQNSIHGHCEIKEFFLSGQDQDDVDIEKKGMIVAAVSYQRHFLRVKFCSLLLERRDGDNKTSLPNPFDQIARPTEIPRKKVSHPVELKRSAQANFSSDWSWLQSHATFPRSASFANSMETLRNILRPLQQPSTFSNPIWWLSRHESNQRRIHTNTEKLFSHIDHEHFDTEYEHVQPEEEKTSHERFHESIKETLSNIHDAAAIKVDEKDVERTCQPEETVKDDKHNLPVICGSHLEIWSPRQCIDGTLCLLSRSGPRERTDSSPMQRSAYESNDFPVHEVNQAALLKTLPQSLGQSITAPRMFKRQANDDLIGSLLYSIMIEAVDKDFTEQEVPVFKTDLDLLEEHADRVEPQAGMEYISLNAELAMGGIDDQPLPETEKPASSKPGLLA
uniref:Uncharacterized protein n=1 Tax=Trichuris muris TaxID=70415 RepID=A0A5S6Q4B4_TRIMR